MKRTFQLLYPKQVDDRRRITPRMLDEIVKNSSEAHTFPVAVGHNAAMGFWDDSQPAAGTMFGNLRLDDADVLLGDIELTPDVEAQYKAKAFPGWSVGIYPLKDSGWHMDHLALLGSVGAAFKDLQEVKTDSFSMNIIERGAQCAEVECYQGENKKALWLVQSTPQPARVETPEALFASARGDQNMPLTPDEIKALQDKAAQAETFKAKMDALEADKVKLQAEADERLKLDNERRGEEFKTIKTDLMSVVSDRGVAQPAKDAFSAALDAFDGHFQAGIVGGQIFKAIKDVIAELRPKIDTGDDGDDGEETFSLKQKWTSKEATDAALA